MVTALVMAGGKGTRMDLAEEKPLIKVNNKPMIQSVIEALEQSETIDKILVAISPNTPKTRKYIKNYPITIIDTQAKGYIEDLADILTSQYVEENEEIMTIVADLPYIKSEYIDEIVHEYHKRQKPAMCVSVKEEVFKKYNINPTLVFDQLVPSGINMLTANNQEQDQTIYITDKIELAFNINTINELEKTKNFKKQ